MAFDGTLGNYKANTCTCKFRFRVESVERKEHYICELWVESRAVVFDKIDGIVFLFNSPEVKENELGTQL